MSLLQEILTRIEERAAEESAAAMRCTELIVEAEALRDRLLTVGLLRVPCDFIPGSEQVVLYGLRADCSHLRKTLAATGIAIKAESIDKTHWQPLNTRTVTLTLRGINPGIRIRLIDEPIPMDEAA